ncbi:MAG TPA: arylsulfatase [Opitutaceae bacterium]|nr:arylsulfatase [Opitutaceae bacterium]
MLLRTVARHQAACLLAFFLLAAAAAASRPNIVFILADDLGYADVGCFGQKRIPTPHLDRIAREGVRFTQFYAGSPVCAPSRNVLMTGQHTGHALFRRNAKLALPADQVTVARLLREAGYRTALVGKWGLGAEGTTGAPLKQGFEHFFGYVDQTHAHNYFPTFLVRNGERVPLRNVVPDEGPLGQGVASVRVDYAAQLIADEAVAWLGRQSRDQPFFLYYAPTLPHANNEGGEKGMEIPDYGAFAATDWPDNEKAFAAMVSQLDRDVGRIIETLERHELGENTIVLFSSDNGPHREGGHDPDFFDSNGPFRGHKRDLYEGGIRVPLLAWAPGRVPAGKTSDFIAYQGDFLATAADLAGIAVPAGLDSVSFRPALVGQTQAARPALYWEFHERATAQAVRDGNWKAVRSPLFTGPVELYDLARDPGEATDVAAQHPEVVARLVRIMESAHVPSPHGPAPANSVARDVPAR